MRGLPAWLQSKNPQNVRLGLGCGQQWLSKPSCPNSENKCKARPGWGQGVAWQGCHGDGAGLGREGMLNEAIVWPKWSTPHKEWHIQTVIQAYCCDGPTECCRSTFIPQGPSYGESVISGHGAPTPAETGGTLLIWRNPSPKQLKDLSGPFVNNNHRNSPPEIAALALIHLLLMLTQSGINKEQTSIFYTDYFPPECQYCVSVNQMNNWEIIIWFYWKWKIIVRWSFSVD